MLTQSMGQMTQQSRLKPSNPAVGSNQPNTCSVPQWTSSAVEIALFFNQAFFRVYSLSRMKNRN